MEHVNIPIPDGLDEAQKHDLIGWLSMKAAEASPDHLPCEDDQAWQAKTTEAIQKGMDEIDAGQGIDARQSMRDLAAELGIHLKS